MIIYIYIYILLIIFILANISHLIVLRLHLRSLNIPEHILEANLCVPYTEELNFEYQKGMHRWVLKSILWTLVEFYFSRGLQRPYTGTCINLQKIINGFFCLLILFLKSKTHQLNLKDMIKLNGNFR